MNFFKKMAIGVATVAMATSAVVGSAMAWEPTKPVDFIIMAGKGGGADKMARLMQSIVEKEGFSARPLVPTNKSGGSGAEALIAAKGANDPDHTIMVTLNSFFTTPLRQPGIDVDIMDFAPVGRMAEDTFLLWVHKDEGISTFEEFLAKAKSEGSNWVMGGTGKNSEDNIITDFLNNNYDLSIKYIPYKGGGAVAKDLAGKQIRSSVNNPSEALGFYESGDVVALVALLMSVCRCSLMSRPCAKRAVTSATSCSVLLLAHRACRMRLWPITPICSPRCTTPLTGRAISPRSP